MRPNTTSRIPFKGCLFLSPFAYAYPTVLRFVKYILYSVYIISYSVQSVNIFLLFFFTLYSFYDIVMV
nr:MAG TPA: hypothetical protein [Caudoviricetes sp.]